MAVKTSIGQVTEKNVKRHHFYIITKRQGLQLDYTELETGFFNKKQHLQSFTLEHLAPAWIGGNLQAEQSRAEQDTVKGVGEIHEEMGSQWFDA
jgi:hypothetical protein